MDKGQVATEFFAYAGVFLLIVVMTAAAVYVTQDAEYGYYESKYIVEVGHSFASACNLAISAGKGFTYTLEFPKTIKGYVYNITFIENSSVRIELDTNHGEIIYPYSLAPFPLEFEGCIDDSVSGMGIMTSNEGNNTLVFYNDGSVLVIKQEGCP